jgi:hypothetical protein
MDSNVVSYGLQYAGMLMEVAFLVYLARSSQRKGLGSVAFYVSSLLVADLTRIFVWRTYGWDSRQYGYTYWCTDFLLVTSAFLLLCLFFRRACLHQEKMWRSIRLLLVFVFVLVVGFSGLTFSRNYSRLFTYFIIEFSQNLYFTCLVLNTLLYLMLQQIRSTDDQLGLLVCGVGIQFAGPAATLALVHLTAGQGFANALFHFAIPLCTPVMLLVWAYAVVYVKDKSTPLPRREVPALAEVSADLNV